MIALCVFVLASLLVGQEPTAPQAVSAAQLQAAIDTLGNLDYATRTAASRTVRRTPAAQAAFEAAWRTCESSACWPSRPS